MAATVSSSGPDTHRCYLSTKRPREGSASRPASSSRSDTGETEEETSKVARNVLYAQSVFRKVVPKTTWILRQEHVPEQRILERRAHYIKSVNPHMLLTLLRSFPSEPPRSSRGITCVPIPKSAQRELVPDFAKHNTWRHYDSSGCTVVYEEGHIKLYGSATAQEHAQEYFMDARHYTRSQDHLDWLSRTQHGSYLPVYELPRPPAWTVRSFIDYVALVTRPRYRRSALRQTYEQNSSHHQAVFRILLDVFTHPDSRWFASTVALRLAVSYCRRHTEHPSTANDIWTAFLESGLYPDVECFNQELGRCLVGKEFNRLCRRILEMKDLDVRPNSTTWALVTTYTERASARTKIRGLAKDAETSGPHSHSSIVVATAKKEIVNYLGTHDGIQKFMAWMESQFGPDWLTSRVLERLLRAGRLGKARMAFTSEILMALREAGKEALIDQRCVVELIKISRMAGDLNEALKLVRRPELSSIADIPQEVIETLFLMAWEKKCFNICRLFWFVGASSGRITFKMQKLVSKSQRSNTTSLEDPAAASWELLAGKVIIGTNLNVEGFPTLFPSLWKSKAASSPIEWLLDWVPDGESRNEQMQLSQLLIERDLHAQRSFQRLTRFAFLDLLDKAIALDEDWKASDAATTLSPRNLVAQCLRIHLEQRDTFLPFRGHTSKAEGRWFMVNGHKLDYNTLQYNENEADAAEPARQLSKDLEGLLDVDFPCMQEQEQEQKQMPVSESQADSSSVRRETTLESNSEEQVAWQSIG